MMNITYYDIGLNLFCKQFKNPEKILENATANDVACILTGTSTRANIQIAEFILNREFVYGTAGIHPHNADSVRKEDFDLIEELITSNPKIVAVGECGLDYDRMYSARENQILCLEKHINLAEKLNKPLFLHERSATEDFIKRFKNHKELCEKSVVHCFTGNKNTLDNYLKLGFSIGITGWICDERRGKDLREAVKWIPLDRILIETDAPYLTPKNIDGLPNINVPENIIYVVKELAKHMNVNEEELIQRAKENTERIFTLN
jgi:TatD DNase family protein